MARILAIDILADAVFGVELTGSGKAPQVAGWFADALPVALTPKNAEPLAAWLLQKFQTSGLRASDVVVSLGRARINWKQANVPDCPPGELPAVVQFAVDGELVASSGEGILDFQAGDAAGGERPVFAAMAPAEVVEAFQAACKIAKLNLRHVVARPYGVDYVALHTLTHIGDANSLIVHLLPGIVEFSAWRGTRLTGYRAVPLADGDGFAKRLVGEIRRTLAAIQSMAEQPNVERIVLVGPIDDASLGAVNASIDFPVDRVDPAQECGLEAAPAEIGGLASAAAIAWRELGEGKWPIDFLKPKKAALETGNRTPVYAMAASLALLLPIGGYSYGRYLVKSREGSIAVIAAEKEKIEKELASKTKLLARHRVVKDWADGEVNWLAELHELTATFPDTTEAYLIKLEGHSNENLASQQQKNEAARPGTLSLEGLTKSQEILSKAENVWLADPVAHYSVSSKGSTSTSERTDFGIRFNTDLGIAPLSHKQYEEREKAAREAFAKSTPADKRRDLVALGSQVVARPAAPINSTAGSATVATTLPNSPPTGRDRRFDRDRSGSSSGTSSGSSSDPIQNMVDRIKAMSFEERESFISSKVPSYLRERVRKRLAESKN